VAELSEKQKIFCQAMLSGNNATQAAIAAGYKKNSAHVSASRLLKDAKIRAYLKAISQKCEDAAIMGASEVLERLTAIGRQKPVASDPLPALVHLGKHHKLFTELHETQHTFTQMPSIKRNGKAVQFEVGNPKPDR